MSSEDLFPLAYFLIDQTACQIVEHYPIGSTLFGFSTKPESAFAGFLRDQISRIKKARAGKYAVTDRSDRIPTCELVLLMDKVVKRHLAINTPMSFKIYKNRSYQLNDEGFGFDFKSF